MSNINFSQRRSAMVEGHIAGRGIESQLLLAAMQAVPREAFLPEQLRDSAYHDEALPIADGQILSQPYLVAQMIEALDLKGKEKVLEVGTGSGYTAAVLAQIAKDVYTVERVGQLAEKAATVLSMLGYRNIHVRHADGARGWSDHAPYDAIVVAAGSPEVPELLKAQLKVGGRLVIPVGANPHARRLVRVTRISLLSYQMESVGDLHFDSPKGVEGRPAPAFHR